MNDFQSLLSTALRDEAEEISMSVDLNDAGNELEQRLDRADRSKRRTTWFVIAGAAAAALVIALGVRTLSTTTATPPVGGPTAVPTAATPLPSASPTTSGTHETRGFTSAGFGIPFVADLPSWTASLDTPKWPTSQQPEWVTWNRCPDGATECIGISFNWYTYILDTQKSKYVPINYTTYLAYLDKLAKQRLIEITDREAMTVGGQPATFLRIVGRANLASGIGCHSDTSCDNFGDGLEGYYAVVDAGSLVQDGQLLVIWTRAGAVAAPEKAWVEDFRNTLTSLRFTTPSG